MMEGTRRFCHGTSCILSLVKLRGVDLGRRFLLEGR